jgi:hypothetical protein
MRVAIKQISQISNAILRRLSRRSDDGLWSSFLPSRKVVSRFGITRDYVIITPVFYIRMRETAKSFAAVI